MSEDYDDSIAPESIEDRINHLEALGAVNIEATQIYEEVEKQFYIVKFDFGYYSKTHNFYSTREVREIVLADSPEQALEHVKGFYTSTFTETDTAKWDFKNWTVKKMYYLTAY